MIFTSAISGDSIIADFCRRVQRGLSVGRCGLLDIALHSSIVEQSDRGSSSSGCTMVARMLMSPNVCSNSTEAGGQQEGSCPRLQCQALCEAVMLGYERPDCQCVLCRTDTRGGGRGEKPTIFIRNSTSADRGTKTWEERRRR